jgi:hypothetical protein
VKRYKDQLWLWSTISISVSLGAIGVAGFVSPVWWISEEDGRCRIGLQRYAAIPLLTCDIVINVYLTLVFVYLLSPLVKGSGPLAAGCASRFTQYFSNLFNRAKKKATVDLHRSNQVMARKVETLLWKTLIGCVLVILPTAGNLAALCVLVGKELAFVSQPLRWYMCSMLTVLLLLDLLHHLHLRWYVCSSRLLSLY